MSHAMDDFFNDALAALLEQVEQNPDRPMEDVVRELSLDLGLDSKDLEILADAVSIIDLTTEKMHQLQAYKEAGGTRDGFIEAELARMTENMTEEEAKAVREAYRINMEEE